MSDFLENIGLHEQGFSDEQIARIDAAKPKAAFVMSWVKEHKTVLNELIDVAEMIASQIEQHQKETS